MHWTLNTTHHMKTNCKFLLLTSIIILSSCTSSAPRNELQNLPTLVEIIGINLSDGKTKVRVSHRNNVTRENSQLSCQLTLKDFKPIQFNKISLPDMTNFAVETTTITLPKDKLPALSKNNNQMPYALDCQLFSDNFRDEHLIKKAILYPVPGTHGEFR